MNVHSWLVWGLAATLLMTTISAGAQGIGLTRMNIPFLLGSMLTPNRDKAKLLGFLVHVASGWVFSLIYIFIFQSLGVAGWWRGMVIGLLHGLFVLVAMMSLMPSMHPRMASEQHGPEAGNLLEPPGFMALNYGTHTPMAVMLSHLVFCLVLGAFYHVK